MGIFNFFKKKQKNTKIHSKQTSNKSNENINTNIPISRDLITTYKGNTYNTSYSKNGIYKCYFNDILSFNNSKLNGEIIIFENDKVLFQKNFNRPNNVKISNDGTVAFCCWLSNDDLSGEFYVLNKFGEKIISKKVKANLGDCQISNDSKIVIFETYGSDNNHSNKIFIINLRNGETKYFEKDFKFSKFNILDNKIHLKINKMIIEYSLDGELIYDNSKIKEIINKAGGENIIKFFQKRVLDNEFLSTYIISNYENILSIKNYSLNKGQKIELSKIYRKIGEYFEKKLEHEKTLKLFEIALELNSKIGLKRKIDILKKKM